MKDMVRRAGCEDKFLIASAATTTEELGNDMYPDAKEELRKLGIPFEPRQARQLRRGEYEYWDYIVVMDGENLADIPELIGPDTEHKGQVELYLRWLKKYEQRDGEDDPIALILCAEESQETVELMELDQGNIHVAQYLTKMPPKELLAKKLADAIAKAREQLAGLSQ